MVMIHQVRARSLFQSPACVWNTNPENPLNNQLTERWDKDWTFTFPFFPALRMKHVFLTSEMLKLKLLLWDCFDKPKFPLYLNRKTMEISQSPEWATIFPWIQQLIVCRCRNVFLCHTPELHLRALSHLPFASDFTLSSPFLSTNTKTTPLSYYLQLQRKCLWKWLVGAGQVFSISGSLQ